MLITVFQYLRTIKAFWSSNTSIPCLNLMPYPMDMQDKEIYEAFETFGILRVASRVHRTEIFKKVWNFVICSCFTSRIMTKHCFFQGGKKRLFFPYFHYENAHLSAHSTLNFAKTFIFLSINTSKIWIL